MSFRFESHGESITDINYDIKYNQREHCKLLHTDNAKALIIDIGKAATGIKFS